MAINISKILSCAVVECSYNKNNECHTPAITVGDGKHASCDTYFRSESKGGIDTVGGVGACKVEDCRYNRSFECTAAGINVGHHVDHADCTTYTPI